MSEILKVQFNDEVRTYLVRPQRTLRVIRHSANGYWETESQYAERGPGRIESEANFSLMEQAPLQGNCEFFLLREDIDNFFRALRARVISREDI